MSAPASTSAAEPLRAAVEELVGGLAGAGGPERAEREKRYLKSDLEHLGVSVGEVRRQVKGALRPLRKGRPGLDRGAVTLLAEELWGHPVHEVRLAAVLLLVEVEGLLTHEDAPLLERLLREARTWALVDPLAIYALGPLRARRPGELAPVLDAWAAADDLWLRRSALLAYLLAVREGDGQAFEAFGARADALLEDEEFFVCKALGWVLREGTKRQPAAVYEWLLPRAGRAAALTVREASKHLPEEQRQALAAARARGRRAR